jgi:hypothetical protein
MGTLKQGPRLRHPAINECCFASFVEFFGSQHTFILA